jgi:hypothetical protein
LTSFVCVRLGWEAMEQAKKRHGLLGTTQGNQVLLDPRGKYIEGIGPRGQRYKIDELAAHLDRVHKEYPGHEDRRGDLKLDWFYVDRFAASAKGQLSGGFVSQVDRKPLAIVEGEEAVPLKDSEFLRRHVRQFVWERGTTEGSPRIVVRQFAPTRTDLATIDLAGADAAKVSEQLDAAWLSYMKERPMVARGYIDNPHGNWLRDVMEQVHLEEVQLRKAAEAGTLTPPGRD